MTRPPRRGLSLTELPEVLPGATEFSDDPELSDAVFLLTALRGFPNVLDELVADTTLEHQLGRKRKPGSWAMIALAFTLSGHVDVEPFWHATPPHSPIWQLAGFSGRPSKQTVWNRLTELEGYAEAFERAANRLIRRAVQHEPRIAQYVWVDATSFESNSRLEHCCSNREACRALGGSPPKWVPRAGAELVKTERHKDSAAEARDGEPEEALKQLDPSRAPETRAPRRRRPYRYFKKGGHLYRTLDPDAGGRIYEYGRKKKGWFGGLSQSAVSFYVGAPVAVNLFAANEQEYDHWPELLGKWYEAVGETPIAAIFDKHYSVKKIFEFNTRKGIASAIPYRGDPTKRADTDFADRHGIPRCRHCGGPGDIESTGLGLEFDRGEPRLRFRCQLRPTSACDARQSIACERDWRMLVPLSRRTPLYHSLVEGGKTFERTFRVWRARYRVAGNGTQNRPKRPGLAWQRLRAYAALLIEWFRICLRHGWLGSHRRRNTSGPARINPGEYRLRATLNTRRAYGIDLPYGPAAVAAGLAVTEELPSERQARDDGGAASGQDPGPPGS